LAGTSLNVLILIKYLHVIVGVNDPARLAADPVDMLAEQIHNCPGIATMPNTFCQHERIHLSQRVMDLGISAGRQIMEWPGRDTLHNNKLFSRLKW
jgi:hypothetical protein